MFKMINQQVLGYSTGKSVQYYVASSMGEEFEGECMCTAESFCCVPEIFTVPVDLLHADTK